MERIKNLLLGKKLFIILYVLKLLMNGVIYHFSPMVQEILNVVFLVWPVIIVLGDIFRKKMVFSVYQAVLWLFIGVIIVSYWNQYHWLTQSLAFSVIKHIGFTYILFSASNDEDPASYELTLQRLAFFAVLYVFIFALVSAVCYWTYKAGISLPMGLNSPDRIFTYGHYGNEDRFCGLFGYSTVGGNLCLLGILLSWYLYESTVFNRWLTSGLTVLFVYMTMLLDYRAGMVIFGFIALYLLYLILRKKYSTAGSILIVILIGAAGCAGIFYLKQDYFARFFDLMKTDPFDAFRQISTGRTEYWYMVIHKLPTHFWLGWGWLNSEALEFYFDAHNLFINLLMWTGVVGCGLFVLFLAMMFIRFILSAELIRKRRATWLVMLVVCILMLSMLEREIAGSSETVETAFFWLSAGYLTYLNRTVKGARDV